MLIRNYRENHLGEITIPGSKDVAIRWVISQKDGAPNFSMRIFEVKPGGYTPFHSHDWEHEVFIKEGEGTLVSNGKEIPFKTGDAIFIPPNEPHQFKNTSQKKLEFICLIPNKGK
jgi:quercetin dioxygenase-like cupin family protein